MTGKQVSLSDFKGKVVLLMSGQLGALLGRGEIPYLKKLEEEMKVWMSVFLGVSVDEARNKQKWIRFYRAGEVREYSSFC